MKTKTTLTLKWFNQHKQEKNLLCLISTGLFNVFGLSGSHVPHREHDENTDQLNLQPVLGNICNV